MNKAQRSPFLDPARARMRETVATIERELSRPPGQAAGEAGKTSPSGLLAAWNDLVAQLALGPEPQVRECPRCRHIGMRSATLCGYCWIKLIPPRDE